MSIGSPNSGSETGGDHVQSKWTPRPSRLLSNEPQPWTRQHTRLGDGMVLFFFNHIVNRIPSHAIRLLCYRKIFHIGENTSILMGVTLWRCGGLYIGNFSTINSGCVIDTRGTITIGDCVNIAGYVQIWTAEHDPDSPGHEVRWGPVTIGDYAWIATRATILPGVSIGEGAVVAAGSVVTKDVAPYTIVAGVPARKVRDRAKDLRYRIRWFPPFR